MSAVSTFNGSHIDMASSSTVFIPFHASQPTTKHSPTTSESQKIPLLKVFHFANHLFTSLHWTNTGACPRVKVVGPAGEAANVAACSCCERSRWFALAEYASDFNGR